MDFLNKAQEFASSGNSNTDGNTDNQGAGAPANSGGFGGLLGEAQSMLNSQGDPSAAAAAGPPQGADSQSTSSGGRPAPTNEDLMQSSKLLLGAAQGQQVDNQQLAGAAENLLGGLAAHGNLDQGQYGTYVNQAQEYLQKYAGQGGQAGAPSGANPASGADASAQ